jgi:hypothetical protein
MQLGRECINNAVKEIVREHAGDVEWPEPDLKKEWKEVIVIGVVSNKVLRTWYRREVKSSMTGRRAEYGLIREAEMRAEYAMLPRAHLHTAQQIARHLLDTMPSTPAPFTKLSLTTIEILIITRMRSHMLSCIFVLTVATKHTRTTANATYPPPPLLPPSNTGTCAHVCSALAHVLSTTPTSYFAVRFMLMRV